MCISRESWRAATCLGVSAHNLELVEMGIQLEKRAQNVPIDTMNFSLSYKPLGNFKKLDISLLEVFFCSLGDGSSERMFDKGDFTIDSCQIMVVSHRIYLQKKKINRGTFSAESLLTKRAGFRREGSSYLERCQKRWINMNS